MTNGEGQPTVERPIEERPWWRRLWPWAVAVLLVAAAAGAAAGITMGSRQGGPLASQGPGGGRPTIIVATPVVVVAAPSPSAVASPSSVSVGGVAATPGAASSPRTIYVVQPGDTLRSIAQDQYGDASEWPRIYQANRDVIGPDPDALVAGTTLQLPRAQ